MANQDLALLIKVTDAATAPLKGIAGTLSSLSQAAAGPTKAVGGLMDGLGKIGLAGIGVGVVKDAFQGLAGAVASPIQAASDLNESLSKVGVIFGEDAAAIQDFAKGAAQGLGQSQGQALAAAGTFGNLFKSLGLSADATKALSIDSVKLGSDLASFHNINPEDALEKLRAGLLGEAEPLRALGVSMNAVQVEAKALEMGLAGTAKELTEADKVQARYAIIMAQTASAQGDFARTSTGMANAQRIISASFQDIQGQIGTQLLPLVAPLVSAFASQLPGAMTMLQGALGSLQGPIQVVQGALEALFGFQNTDALQLGLERIFGADSPLVGGAMDLILGTVDGLRGAFETLGTVLGTVAAVVTDTIAPALGEHFSEIMTAAGAILTAVVVPAFVTWAVAAGAAAAATIVALAPVLVPLAAIGAAAVLLRAAWESNFGGIQDKTAAMWAFIQPILQAVLNEVGRFTTEMLPLATAAWTTLSGVVTGVASALWSAIQTGVSGLVSFWQTNHDTIGRVVSVAWGLISGYVKVGWELVQGIIKTGLQLLSGDWSGAWQTIQNTLASVWGHMKDAIPPAWALIKDAIGGAIGGIGTLITTKAGELGSGFVQSIQDGVGGALGGFKTWITDNLANALPQWVRDVLGIHSPSNVFADIGANMIRGLEVGIKAQWPSVETVVQRLMSQFAGLGTGMGGSVESWLAAAMGITGVGGDWMAGLRKLVQLESSGNPTIVNPIEVLGQHATGLLQMLPSTFRAHMLDGLDDIFNPVHNAVSSIRYIMDTYGHVNAIPGITDGREFPGYKDGGYVDRTGPALLHGGEYVLPAEMTRRLQHGGGGGGNIVFQAGAIVVQGSVVTEQDLIIAVQRGIIQASRRNGGNYLGGWT